MTCPVLFRPKRRLLFLLRHLCDTDKCCWNERLGWMLRIFSESLPPSEPCVCLKIWVRFPEAHFLSRKYIYAARSPSFSGNRGACAKLSLTVMLKRIIIPCFSIIIIIFNYCTFSPHFLMLSLHNSHNFPSTHS